MIYGNEFLPAEAPFSRDRARRSAASPLLSPLRPVRLRRGAARDGRRWRCCSPAPPIGLRMRAAAFAPEVSRLLGRQRRPDAHPRLGAGRGGRRAGRRCWSSRPSWACTRTRWTSCSSPRSPRRWSAGWTARSGAVVGGLVGRPGALLRQRLPRQRRHADRGAGPAAGGAAGPARRAVLRVAARRGRYDATAGHTLTPRPTVAAPRRHRCASVGAGRRLLLVALTYCCSTRSATTSSPPSPPTCAPPPG